VRKWICAWVLNCANGCTDILKCANGCAEILKCQIHSGLASRRRILKKFQFPKLIVQKIRFLKSQFQKNILRISVLATFKYIFLNFDTP
jgi:hypothetical protein